MQGFGKQREMGFAFRGILRWIVGWNTPPRPSYCPAWVLPGLGVDAGLARGYSGVGVEHWPDILTRFQPDLVYTCITKIFI